MSLLQGPRVLILLLLISFASVSAVLFTPGLPELADFFGVSASSAQATMSVFLFGYALGQLPYGPLANRFGRKKTIYIGVFLALFGTLLCWKAPTFNWLLIGRFVQALGTSVGLKISFTMIGDSRMGAAATKTLSYVMLAFAITPGLGVALGGFLTTYFGWQGCFLFLAAYCVFVGLLCLLLPETAHQLDRDALQVKKIIHGYLRQVHNPGIMLHAYMMGLGSALIYIFSTQSPYVGINQIGLTPEQFGLFNLFPPCGLALGMLTASRFAGKTTPRKSMLLGICILLSGVVVMALCFLNGAINAWTLFVPQFITMIGNSMIFSNASSLVLHSATDKSNASAVSQFINVGFAAIGTTVIAAYLPKTAITLPIVFGTIGILALFLWCYLKPLHRKTAS